MTARPHGSPIRILLSVGMGDLLSRIGAFLAFVYLARVLGPDHLGLIGFGAAIAGLGLPVIDFGLGFIGIRDVGRDPARLRGYVMSILFNRIMLGTVTVILLVLAAKTLVADESRSNMMMLYALTLVPSMLNLTWASQVSGRPFWFTVEKGMHSLIYLVAVVVFVHGATEVERVPVILSFAGTLSAILVLAGFFRTAGMDETRLDIRRSLSLLRQSFTLFIPTFLSHISLSVGLLLVAELTTLYQAGIFSAASRVYVLSFALPSLLWSAFFPTISSAASSSRGSTMEVLFRYTLLVAVILGSVGSFFAPDIVAFVLGASYEEAVLSFRVFSIAAGLQCISVVTTRMLPASGRDSVFRNIVALGLVTHIVAGVVLIPRLGAAGGAVALLLSESVMVIASAVRTPELQHRTLLRITFRALMSAVVACSAGWLLSSLGIGVVASLGCVLVIYTVLLERASLILKSDIAAFVGRLSEAE